MTTKTRRLPDSFKLDNGEEGMYAAAGLYDPKDIIGKNFVFTWVDGEDKIRRLRGLIQCVEIVFVKTKTMYVAQRLYLYLADGDSDRVLRFDRAKKWNLIRVRSGVVVSEIKGEFEFGLVPA